MFLLLYQTVIVAKKVVLESIRKPSDLKKVDQPWMEKRDVDRAAGHRPRRWVVERTHGWLNRFRGILIRWDKKVDNHIANLHLACAYSTLSRAGVFG